MEAILSRDPSVTVKLLGFQDRFVRDDLLCEELMVRLGKDGARRVQNCSYRGDIDVLLRDFASCSRVLAVRFHSGILALGLGLPMVQIVYSNKIEEFLQDAGWQGLLVPLQGLATIEDAPLIDALFAAPGAEYLPPEARAHAAGLRP
ncbi:polysaccharide pyruvyl transferase WcaK-like protein [Nocardioides massiliensis]|uniref:Polysaccharide pyruvyl transferase WcaK-like protein n=1 Tax=Nocardioides massiliensis TaxID=1325935 RepID=A0ABT9NNM7_9ACTN|nr:hypothetical protein [Nocardioides massiliensis]MDP9821804.1 polysaccharide pyruvyl transferase WcaK-like protein [Nocardioides massiliensis]